MNNHLPTRRLWLVLAAVFVAVEVYALANGVPGDTLSGVIGPWIQAHPARGLLLIVTLSWLAWHWLRDTAYR